ncbi:MAG: transglutaminase domain-containing protein [Capsulimonadales bacterium]|nr:transglutaminase domain-containing protein [Capsulimonadales bacterium]
MSISSLSGTAQAQTPYSQMPKRRSLSVTTTCALTDVPSDARQIDLWIPVFSENDRQTVRLVTTDLQGGRITRDPKFGNRMLYRRITDPAKELTNGTLTIVLSYEVEIREQVVAAAKTLPSTVKVAPDRALDPYLGDWNLIPIAGPITELAARIDLPKGEPLRAGRRIYDYLIDTMPYNYRAPGAGRGDAVWACDSKTGDCSDYHSVFIGVSRSLGIPADHVFGVPFSPDKPSGETAYYHCWARFWVGGIGWVPVDASEADKHPTERDYLFGSLSTRCLELSHGRDIVLEPRQAGEPLNTFVKPLAEVDGKPFAGVRWSCAYGERTDAGSP